MIAFSEDSRVFAARGARTFWGAARFLVLLLIWPVCGEVRAQNSSFQGEVRREWQAGQNALGAKKFDAALAHFDRIVTAMQKPEVPMEAKVLAEAFALRADAHYGAKNWQGAVADYSRCIELDPKNAAAFAFRGVARRNASGDYAGLLADTEIAAKLDPEYQYMLDDARSTVLWRRVKLGFLGLGVVVLAIGVVPLLRGIALLIKAGA